MRITRLLTAGSLVLATGCASYTSTYQPPADGRARPIWDDNKVVFGVDATTDECLAAAQTEPFTPHYHHEVHGGGVFVVWAPVPIVHHVHSSGPVAPVRTPAGHASHGGPGGVGGGGGNGAKEAYVAIAVAMIVASPIIAYGLALGRPEPEEEVARAVDQINAYNDLARMPGTPCSY